jgi:hypothetical protein
MDELKEILEFLYYSIIFFVVVLFFSLTIDIMSTKIFPQNTDKYIIVEIFTIWICLSLVFYYSKYIIYQIPNPFTNSTLKKDNFTLVMIIVLVPLIISCSVKNMKAKTGYLYDNYEKFLNFR